MEKTNHIESLDDLASRFRILVSSGCFNEASTLVLSFFYRKIKLNDNYKKAVMRYNKVANSWNETNKFGLPRDFVYHAFYNNDINIKENQNGSS